MATFDTQDRTGYYKKNDISENKFVALLSYIGPLVLIPIFAAKDSPYARFHATQGFSLLILEIVWSILALIIGAIMDNTLFTGILWGIISWIVSLLLIAIAILGIITVVQGKAKHLPIVGGFDVLSRIIH